MQAIRTRYYGPTNTRGSRIVAKCEAGTYSMPYNHALNLEENHAACAAGFIAKLNWTRYSYACGVFEGDYYWSPSLVVLESGSLRNAA